mmetsp:Transcript_5295/g.7718  ORF Transcript_5295/g.7718 Transcript_5295/m.7718 type:complete len:389 (+) Transcript_5295:125-1291(+)
MRSFIYQLPLFLILINTASARWGYNVDEKNQSNPPAPPEFTSTPSSSPSSWPSKIPSSSPSISPTTSPSTSPTSSPSSIPTTVPSFSPTNVPSVTPKCVTDDAGSFGTTTETISNDETVSALTVFYIYEVEIEPTSLDSNFILSNIEDSISDVVLADMFEDCPITSGTRRKLLGSRGMVRRRANDVIGNVVGFSSSPDDEVDDATGCSTKAPGTICLRVEGRFNLYTLSGPEDGITYVTKEYALGTLKAMMEDKSSDLYLELDESIINIRYIDPSPPAIVSNAEILQTQESSGNGIWIGLSAGAGTVLIAGAFLAWRRKSNDTQEYMSPIKDVNDTSSDNGTILVDRDAHDTGSISSTGSYRSWFRENGWNSFNVGIDNEGNIETIVL